MKKFMAFVFHSTLVSGRILLCAAVTIEMKKAVE
jgi:hypothetical protein